MNRGYPSESHLVTTNDGYILEMHRIPHGKHSPPSPNKPAVFVLHGLICSSADWIISPDGLGRTVIILIRCIPNITYFTNFTTFTNVF